MKRSYKKQICLYKALVVSCFTTPFVALSAEVSITIDDPGVQTAPGMTHLQVGEKILNSLKQNNLKTILFVCGKRIDSVDGQRLLGLWSKQKHILANHTYSHESYSSAKITFDFFSKDTSRNEELISRYDGFRRIFRYPMLKEGNTEEKRDLFHSFLKKSGYSLGYVTIDASDWYISDRLVAKLIQKVKVNLDAYKTYYLNHIWDRAQYYNSLSKRVLGRDVKHNLLIHHNPLNAFFLDDLIKMFKSKGWKVINAEEAFQDPVYSKVPQILPAGESLLWALAKETGKFGKELRYPGEDGEYLEEEMNRLGL